MSFVTLDNASAVSSLDEDPVKPMRAFELRVSAVQQLSEHFRRITLTGADLALFGSNAAGETLDLRVKVMIPSPGHALPELSNIRGSLQDDWYQGWLAVDEAVRGVMRTYTVRALRPAVPAVGDQPAIPAELDIDFVLHLDGGSGPAAQWAVSAQPGDALMLVGPCARWGDCLGIEFAPGDSERLLLVGDETAVPAIAATSGERFFSLVARDMRERELREAQQRHHQDELAHTARLVTLGELASGIAHEINQPLAAVMNYASASQRYLQNLATTPEAATRVAQGLERITLHAGHASQVIKRLRGFLRKGRRTLQALDVSEVVRQAVNLCAWEARERQVTIEQELPAILPLVYADRVLLEQVLLNLLRNAIDANCEQQPGQPSRIRISVQAGRAGVLSISVEDQGPGVTAEQFEQLFTPFYTSKAEGLGLGLSMSRSIIEGFGGELDAKPQAHGLRMCCRLPLMPATQQQEESN